MYCVLFIAPKPRVWPLVIISRFSVIGWSPKTAERKFQADDLAQFTMKLSLPFTVSLILKATLLLSGLLWRLSQRLCGGSFGLFSFSIFGLSCVHLTDGWSHVSNIYGETLCDIQSRRLPCAPSCGSLENLFSGRSVTQSVADRPLGQSQLQSPQPDHTGSLWKWTGNTAFYTYFEIVNISVYPREI